VQADKTKKEKKIQRVEGAIKDTKFEFAANGLHTFIFD